MRWLDMLLGRPAPRPDAYKPMAEAADRRVKKNRMLIEELAALEARLGEPDASRHAAAHRDDRTARH